MISSCKTFEQQKSTPQVRIQFKKIKILASNNYQIINNYNQYTDTHVKGSENLKELISYVQNKMASNLIKKDQDPEVIIEILNWVGSQWKHDGMLSLL